MKKIYGMVVALALALMMSATFAVAWTGIGGVEGDSYDDDIDVAWTDTPPTIDGDIKLGEYDNATVVDIEFYPNIDYATTPHRNDTIYLYFMNDAEYLYIAVDVLPDNTSDGGDYCYLAFDEDANDLWEDFLPDYESWYVVYMSNQSAIVRSENPDLKPIGESSHPFIWDSDFTGTINDDDVEHRVWEFKIPISNFLHGNLDLGDSMKMQAYGYGTLAPTWDYPINSTADVYDDASNWATITLAEEPTVTEEAGYSAGTYAMIMVGIGALISLVVLLFYEKTIVEWISRGDFKTMFIVMGASVGLQFAGVLQFYYDWLGSLGLV